MNEQELANSAVTVSNMLCLARKVIDKVTPELDVVDKEELVSIAEAELNNELINRGE